jgi:flagellar protein FlaG
MEDGCMTDPISSMTQSVLAPVPAVNPAADAANGAATGAQSPGNDASAAANPSQPTLPDLQAVAAALNQHVQDLQTSLHFQVDKITGQLVVSVIDTQNNQLLLQIPSQEALAIAQSLEPLQMQLMKQTA